MNSFIGNFQNLLKPWRAPFYRLPQVPGSVYEKPYIPNLPLDNFQNTKIMFKSYLEISVEIPVIPHENSIRC